MYTSGYSGVWQEKYLLKTLEAPLSVRTIVDTKISFWITPADERVWSEWEVGGFCRHYDLRWPKARWRQYFDA